MAVAPSTVTIFGHSYDSFFLHFAQTDSAANSWNVRYRNNGTTTWSQQNITNPIDPYHIDKVVKIQGSSGTSFAGNLIDIEVQSVQGSLLSSWVPVANPPTLIGNPLVDYPLEGNLNDISFNGTHATSVGGTITYTYDPDLQRDVLTLNGSIYAKASNIILSSSDNASYTKMGWARVAFSESANLISSSTGSPNNSHTAWLTHNSGTINTTGYTLKAGHGGTLNHIVSSTLFPLYTWQHFAVTYNNSTKVISTYLNGNLTGQVTLTTSFAGTTEFNLGSYSGGSSTMQGYLSRVKWFNFALSGVQVRAIYNNEALFR